MSNKGRIDMTVGSMFSGKTTKFLDSLERAELAKKRVIVFKPENDDRYGSDIVTDRNKRIVFKAHLLPIEINQDKLEELYELVKDYDVIGIDEVQFLGQWIVPFCQRLREQGKRIDLCGLDMDYKAEPFGEIGSLMAISNKIHKLEAVCMVCGEDANYTQRKLNGQPAPAGETIAIGDNQKVKQSHYTYEARCQNCYVHPSKANKDKKGI